MKNIKGFTLIEIVISFAIFLLIFGWVFYLVSAGRDAWTVADARIGLQQDVRRSLQTMSRDVAQSSLAQVLDENEDGLLEDTAYQEIRLKVPASVSILGGITWGGFAVDVQGDIVFDFLDAGNTIIYRMNEDSIVMLVEDTNGQVSNPYVLLRDAELIFKDNTGDIGSSFEYLGGARAVKISIVALRRNYRGIPVRVEMVTMVHLRNVGA